MKRIKHIITILGCTLLLFTGGCVEEFNAILPDSETNLLVVEGNIVSDSTCTFTLSRSVSLNEDYISGIHSRVSAEIAVKGSDGSTYQGFPANPWSSGLDGKYSVKVGTLKPEHSYYLEIIWEGNTYQSTPQQPLTTEELSLSFSQGEDDGKVRIEASTPQAPNGEAVYYHWSYTEDWEIRTQYRCKAVYEPDMDQIVEYDYYPYAQGWIHKEQDRILVEGTDKYQDKHLNKAVLYSIEHTDNRLCHLYRTFVTQRKISKTEYDYYQCRAKFSDEMGGLFTPQPTELPTNITCTNADKRAIGYVGVNMNVCSDELYVSTKDVVYEPDYKCSYYTPIGMSPKEIYSQLGYEVCYYYAPSLSLAPPTIKWSNRICVDCRAQGADPNGRPDFWPQSDL